MQNMPLQTKFNLKNIYFEKKNIGIIFSQRNYNKKKVNIISGEKKSLPMVTGHTKIRYTSRSL